MKLPASAAGLKLNGPGVENNLLSDDIRNGGAVCEFILFSMSSSLCGLK